LTSGGNDPKSIAYALSVWLSLLARQIERALKIWAPADPGSPGDMEPGPASIEITRQTVCAAQSI
jgi:hypothetical protein